MHAIYATPVISIHAPTRGATKQYRAKTNVNAKFQSTLPRGERQISTYPVLWRQKFQSTLPRGERLPVQINILPALFISIHAPTRGATIVYIVNCDGYIDFNPRSHEGSDSEDRINIYQVNISIHAPTRGATPVSTPIPGIHCIFQSTLPRGERRITGACWKQST